VTIPARPMPCAFCNKRTVAWVESEAYMSSEEIGMWKTAATETHFSAAAVALEEGVSSTPILPLCEQTSTGETKNLESIRHRRDVQCRVQQQQQHPTPPDGWPRDHALCTTRPHQHKASTGCGHHHSGLLIVALTWNTTAGRARHPLAQHVCARLQQEFQPPCPDRRLPTGPHACTRSGR
jgi:hypothetical protein